MATPKKWASQPRHDAVTSKWAILQSSDLTFAGHAAGLRLHVDAAELQICAETLSLALTACVQALRAKGRRTSAQEHAAWCRSLIEWSKIGARLLEGPDGEPTLAVSQTLSIGALHWPSDSSRVNDVLLRDMWRAGAYSPVAGEEADFSDSAQRMLPMLTASLRAVRKLATNAGDHFEAQIKSKPTATEKTQLFMKFAVIYERLYRRNLAVSNTRQPVRQGNAREQRPGGPGLRWCQALFQRAVKSARQGGCLSDMPELEELADWAAQPDTVSARLKIARKHMRDMGMVTSAPKRGEQ